MGYETEVFLVEASPMFTEWHTKDTWCHAESQWRDLPKDAQVCDGGVVVASLKLAKIGRSSEDGDLLADIFDRDREKQKKEKKFVALRWFWYGPDQQEEWAEFEDSYGDPLVIHDAKETLEALRRTIKWNKENEDWVYRRYTLFEGMLAPFVEDFHNPLVISRGY